MIEDINMGFEYPGRKMEATDPASARGETVDRAPSRSGLPGPLQRGLQQLSGFDFSGVRVHRGSAKPAPLNAHAHTQGQHIYLAPGQDRQLSHEAWHVAQQMQGRVQATTDVAGTPVNDDVALEREADRMGSIAQRLGADSSLSQADERRYKRASMQVPHGGTPVQRAMKFEIQTTNFVWRANKRGSWARLAERKYGRFGKTESGDEGFLSTGVVGDTQPLAPGIAGPRQTFDADPHVHKGDMVPAKKVDPALPAQYIWTYTVINQATGEVRRKSARRTRGKVNRRTYELKYVDADGNPLDIHLDPLGRFQPGAGPIMKKAKKFKEGSAIEVQAESGGFVEFETPKWHRRWSNLRNRIQEAFDITKAMDAAPEVADPQTLDTVRRRITQTGRTQPMGVLREWPNDPRTGHLPIIRQGGRLMVEIVSPAWRSRVQSSESLLLSQYSSLLDDHEVDVTSSGHTVNTLSDTLNSARAILNTLVPPGSTLAAFESSHPNLKGFVQMVVNYIVRGQRFSGKHRPAKFNFALMSRTSFYSMFHNILDSSEQALFLQLVNAGTIPSQLGLTNGDPVFKRGHGGLSGRHRDNPKIGAWLRSISTGGGYNRDLKLGARRQTDLLSKPKRGSGAMGRFGVSTKPGSKHQGLIRVEARRTGKAIGSNDMNRDQWVPYAERVFKNAATKRARPDVADDPATMEDETVATGLIYDP